MIFILIFSDFFMTPCIAWTWSRKAHRGGPALPPVPAAHNQPNGNSHAADVTCDWNGDFNISASVSTKTGIYCY